MTIIELINNPAFRLPNVALNDTAYAALLAAREKYVGGFIPEDELDRVFVFVTAPSAVNKVDLFPNYRGTGAWGTKMESRRLWVTRFCGNHQVVPWETTGKTPGRSLRKMRRLLEREQIPLR